MFTNDNVHLRAKVAQTTTKNTSHFSFPERGLCNSERNINTKITFTTKHVCDAG